MKKTAVEWLENQIMTSKYFYKLMEDINSRSTIAQSNIFEQAKEIEKVQIIAAYEKGEFNQGCDSEGEQYYSEKFKKD